MTKDEAYIWIRAKVDFINGDYYDSDISVRCSNQTASDQYVISVDKPDAKKMSTAIMTSGEKALAFLSGVENTIKLIGATKCT